MSAIRNERGVGVAAAIFFVLILATMGYMCLTLAIEDLHGAAANADSEAALMIAQAGLDFGVAKLLASSSWAGVGAPGKPVGRGVFTVTVDTNDESGSPLPSGQKMVLADGQVGTAMRRLRRLVSSGSGGTASATVFASNEGDAVSYPSGKRFTNMPNIHDSSSGPNNVWGSGDFNPSDPHEGVFGGTSSTGLTGTILTVEAALDGYVDGALTNDDTDVQVYFNNSAQGGALTLSTSELNTRVGSGNKGYWYVNVTSVRSWALTDFAGDLELYIENLKTGSDDGRTLYLDAVGYRVTVQSGSSGIVASSFKEVVL